MSNPNVAPTRERKHGVLKAVTALAIGAGAMLVANRTGYVDINAHHDNKTIEEIYADANQDCATASANEVVSNIDVKEGDTLASMTATANAEAATLTDKCTAEATGIPTGTPGFETLHPAVTLDINAAVVQG